MLNTIIKTAVIYILIIISMRIMGKKLAGQLQPYELVITLMIAEIAAAPIDSGDTPMTAGLIPTLTLLIVYSVFSFLSLKSRKIRVFFCGRPSILISNGKLMTEEFEKLSYSLSDLMEQLRSAGYSDVRQICYAILETNGELSILPYPAETPPTAKMLGIRTEKDSIQLPIILDGDTVDFGLSECGFSRESLENWLKKRKLGSISDIFLLSVAKDGSYFCQRKNGSIERG